MVNRKILNIGKSLATVTIIFSVVYIGWLWSRFVLFYIEAVKVGYPNMSGVVSAIPVMLIFTIVLFSLFTTILFKMWYRGTYDRE